MGLGLIDNIFANAHVWVFQCLSNWFKPNEIIITWIVIIKINKSLKYWNNNNIIITWVPCYFTLLTWQLNDSKKGYTFPNVAQKYYQKF